MQKKIRLGMSVKHLESLKIELQFQFLEIKCRNVSISLNLVQLK